ncbi:zinc finger, CCHC-type containing protein, partial [Tanacetum coccineum]
MAVAAIKHMTSNFATLDKFEGVDFRRWQKKMHFLLSSMSVLYVLTTPIPEDGGDDATMEQIRKMAKWDNDDYVCRGLILKEAKYMAEDALSKKFFVSCIIDKLHPSWKDFKHKKQELTLVELGSHLRIEESLKVQDSDKPKGQQCCWSTVIGHGCVDLSSGKIISLFNVLHVPNIRKNLVSSSILNNCGYKQETESESDKFVLSKYGVLGHVHFKRMQDMSKDGLIIAFDMDTEKCKTCMLTKITNNPFQNVKRKTEVLELIHSDLCDLHATPSLENKKYFVTFIDDASRAVVRLPDPKLKTLGKRGIECIFVGYAEHSKAFRFYVIEPNESVSINSIIESRDAIFDENRFSSVPRPSIRFPKGTEDIGGTRDKVSDQHSYCFNVEDDPKIFDEAMKSQDVAFWKEAINDEMDYIMGNNTW